MRSSISSTSRPDIGAGCTDRLVGAWYRGRSWTLVLLPLAGLFQAVAALRAMLLRRRARRLPVPVIIVGNLAVGGTGKTPLVIALARALKCAGLRVGVVSRGYGGRRTGREPCIVAADSDAGQVGDEAVLIAATSGCPVAVAADRHRAAMALLGRTPVDLILSDDGLQHYRLARDVEVAVIDAARGLGNGHCLPAGPLREPARRLATVDLVVVNGVGFTPRVPFFTMRLAPVHFRHLASGALIEPTAWPHGRDIHAVAGIGNPARFAATLTGLGLAPRLHPFPDHHVYRPAELDFGDTLPVVMTAKDAVKCAAFAEPRWWALDVAAQLPEEMLTLLLARIRALLPTTGSAAR